MKYTDNDLLKLYEDTDFYDLEFLERSKDVNFYKKYCKNFSGDILEIACGTGRITSEIAKINPNIEGKDLSESMILKARKNYPQLNFYVENMIYTKGTYDLIFCATNAFQHILEENKALIALTNIKSSLNLDGKFILDIQNPNEQKLKRKLDKPYKYKSFLYKGKVTDAFITGHYDLQKSIYYFVINYFIDGITIKTKSVAMKMFRHSEIQTLIAKSGLKIVECYGNYAMTKYNSDSEKQIFILK